MTLILVRKEDLTHIDFTQPLSMQHNNSVGGHKSPVTEQLFPLVFINLDNFLKTDDTALCRPSTIEELERDVP